jgi:hypothetical protein
VAANKPLWRQGVEVLDKVAAPVLEGATRHEVFGLGYALFDRGRRAVSKRTERVSQRVLHSLNLPTASDVNRLLAQLAAVEHRIRQVDEHLETERDVQ